MGTIVEDVDAGAKWIATALSSSGYKADFTPSSLWEIDRFFACLASYWLLFIILPAALVLWLVPTGKRLGFALPIGLVLILGGENGFRGWKQLWRVK